MFDCFGNLHPYLKIWFSIKCDTPPSSLMDSIVSPKVKTTEGKGVGAQSLTCNISGVEGHAGALTRKNDK